MNLAGFRSWLATLKAESASFSISDSVRLVLSKDPLPPKEILMRRYRACSRCSVWSGIKTKRCRPWPEADWGCGCWLPAKVFVGGGCWAWDTLGDKPSKHIGWSRDLVDCIYIATTYRRLRRLALLARVLFNIRLS